MSLPLDIVQGIVGRGVSGGVAAECVYVPERQGYDVILRSGSRDARLHVAEATFVRNPVHVAADVEMACASLLQPRRRQWRPQ